MARGHFYTPPPTFIGGRQPYAPPLGRAQDGTLTVSQPIPIDRRWLSTVVQTHRDQTWTLIYVASIAPILAPPPTIDNPPPSTNARLMSVIRQWDVVPNRPPPLLGVGQQSIAAPINPPPVVSYANQAQIRAQWEPRPWWPLPSLKGVGQFSVATTPDNPPRVSYATQNLTRDQWTPRPWWPLPHLTFQVQGVVDTTPDAFAFVAKTGVARSRQITSAGVTITGLNAASAISVVGGEYSVNGAEFTDAVGSVVNGDVIYARHTSAAGYGADTDTVVTIGGVSGTFTSTTLISPTPRHRRIPSKWRRRLH